MKSPSPGIQSVIHTVLHNGAANKKVQIHVNILDSLVARQACESMRKTCELKRKPISATNAAFTPTLGLLACQMSRPYKTETFEILKQAKK